MKDISRNCYSIKVNSFFLHLNLIISRVSICLGFGPHEQFRRCRTWSLSPGRGWEAILENVFILETGSVKSLVFRNVRTVELSNLEPTNGSWRGSILPTEVVMTEGWVGGSHLKGKHSRPWIGPGVLKFLIQIFDRHRSCTICRSSPVKFNYLLFARWYSVDCQPRLRHSVSDRRHE